jgi:hypothetical protein
LSSVLIGIRPRRFPPSPTIREDEDERVNGPEGQGVGPGRDPGERQAEAARREMHDVVPAVDLENAEYRVALDWIDREAPVVEEADDSGDDEHPAHAERVEAGWREGGHEDPCVDG